MKVSLGLPLLLVACASAVEITNFNQIKAAKKSPDKKITIRNLHVPAGVMLDLTNLQEGTVVQFLGRVTFAYKAFKGTMIKISGKNIRVEGKPGSLLDGEGHRWWDGKGGNDGKEKPRFMEVNLENSVVTGIKIKNPPAHCFVAKYCKNVFISNINIDIKDGDKMGGHNTDGIGVVDSKNVTVSGAKVWNQDDCFCSGSGSDITIENFECNGPGHGMSIGSMGAGKTVKNYIIRNSKINRNTNGIRIKTRRGETGLVKNVRFENIELKDITKYGILIQSNYYNSGPKGDPTPFPIEDLVIKNVHGTVHRNGVNIHVWMTPGSAKHWTWKSDIKGGQRETSCKGVPAGLNIHCGKKQ